MNEMAVTKLTYVFTTAALKLKCVNKFSSLSKAVAVLSSYRNLLNRHPAATLTVSRLVNDYRLRLQHPAPPPLPPSLFPAWLRKKKSMVNIISCHSDWIKNSDNHSVTLLSFPFRPNHEQNHPGCDINTTQTLRTAVTLTCSLKKRIQFKPGRSNASTKQGPSGAKLRAQSITQVHQSWQSTSDFSSVDWPSNGVTLLVLT